jgi:hypothetical protein
LTLLPTPPSPKNKRKVKADKADMAFLPKNKTSLSVTAPAIPSHTRAVTWRIGEADNLYFSRYMPLVGHQNYVARKKCDCVSSQKSYSIPINIDFQRRYATIVLELEQLNKDLNKVLHKVQQYCYEVGEPRKLPSNLHFTKSRVGP